MKASVNRELLGTALTIFPMVNARASSNERHRRARVCTRAQTQASPLPQVGTRFLQMRWKPQNLTTILHRRPQVVRSAPNRFAPAQAEQSGIDPNAIVWARSLLWLKAKCHFPRSEC